MALVPTTTPRHGTVSEFLKLVAEAGGTANLATFARLGVVNTPAVRESFPVLLDHGVPEAVLVAILAPVPPAAPMPMVSQTRNDVPERRSSAGPPCRRHSRPWSPVAAPTPWRRSTRTC